MTERPECPTCGTAETVREAPEAGYWTCTECGERGSGTEERIWWRNDPESVWYVEDDEEIVTDGGRELGEHPEQHDGEQGRVGHCENCGRETDELYISFWEATGWVCGRCRSHYNDHGELPDHQEGLGRFVTDGGRDMAGEQIPALDDVVDMELKDDEERRWMVLFDEDYDDLLIDAGDSVALLLDCNQAVEVVKLASQIVSALAPEHAPDEEPIEAIIAALQEVSDGAE